MSALPGPLPEGETLLWEGAPRALPFLRQVFHANLLVGYVGLLSGWCLVLGARAGTLGDAALAVAQFAALSAVAFGLLGFVSWLQCKAAHYAITTRRVVITCGAAFEKSINLPFARLDEAFLREHADGTGDIVLVPQEGETISRWLLWPHVRPWHFTTTQPALRAVPEARAVAQILGRALAAQAGQTPAALPASTAVQGGAAEVAHA